MPYITADDIYPKRLGLMKGNILVLEYYNIANDKFKKHPIPFNPLNDPKETIDEIFKDPKHLPFLKRVNPKDIKAVIQGRTVESAAPASRPFSAQRNDIPYFQQEEAQPPPNIQVVSPGQVYLVSPK